MAQPPSNDRQTSQRKQAPTAREERLVREAQALRANLLKRKQQARERDKPKEG
jgi:hypothetical protein